MCGSDTYLVHKNIICPQSDFFRAACRPNTFKEGQTGVINIPASSGRNDDFFTRPISIEDFDWDLDVETTKSVKLMIHYFYHHDYLEQETSPELRKLVCYNTKARKGLLAEHSRMYAMGEKYGIPGLKTLAATKFRKTMTYFNHAGLTAGIIIAYKSTPEADKQLRDVVLDGVDSYRVLYLEDAEIQQIISSIPDLAYGLFLRCARREVESLAREGVRRRRQTGQEQ